MIGTPTRMAIVKNRRNYYRLLQVQPDAAPEVITASYRTMMQKLRYHPDLGGDEGDASLVNEAYAVLSDPERRARYDATRRTARMGLGDTGRAGVNVERGAARRRNARPATPMQVLDCPLCGASINVPSSLRQAVRCLACDSPLRPVQAAERAAARARAVPRLARNIQVRFEAGPARGTGWAQDISSHGMRMHTARRLTVGVPIRIECELLCAVARVTRCRRLRGPGYSVGLAFITAEFTHPQGSFLNTTA